jgi:hypothetical protein
MWDLVVWVNEDAIDYVPSVWKHEEKNLYKYPRGLSETKLRQYVYDCKDVKENYRWCAATIKKRGIKSLQKAKSLCDQGRYTTNLEESESEEGELTGKRVTKPTKRFLDSDSEEEHDVSKKKKTRQTDIGDSGGSKEQPILDKQFFVPELSNSSKVVERSKSPNVSAVSNISSASTLTVSSRSSSSYQDLFGERVVFELQQIGKRLNTMENILLHKSSETVSEVIDPFITNLPAKTNEQLQELNISIQNDENKFKQLVRSFCRFIMFNYIIDYMASLGQYVLFIGRRRSTKNGLFNNEKNI